VEISSKGSKSFSAKGEGALGRFSAQSGDVEAQSGRKARVVKLVPNKNPVVHKPYNFKMHKRKRL
jgi:hypothetical protein